MSDYETGQSRIRLHLAGVLGKRGFTLTELAGRVGITLANLSILKNNKARAVRFSTLEALCRELKCQPGDLLEFAEGGQPLTMAGPEQAGEQGNHGLPGDYY